MLATNSNGAAEKNEAALMDYLRIARFDHSTKHIFIVPGMFFAYILRGVQVENVQLNVALGLITAICIASANYVINEWLDRDFDKHHPSKSKRTAVNLEMRGSYIVLEWLAFMIVGLGCAWCASKTMFWVACLFGLQGIFYNVPPLRLKDKAYFDVISESINNPIRLMIGWVMIDPTTLPPSSIILSYYLGGAFLMGAKRLSEYREIVESHGRDLLIRYRASFGGYTETSLTVSCFMYAMSSAFFLTVFLIKYRVEYILMLPFIIVLFGHYLALSMQPGSSAQKPEKLFKERVLMFLVLLVTGMFLTTTFIDIPYVETLTKQKYIFVQ